MYKDNVSPSTPEQLQQRLTRPNKPSNVANDDLDEVVENPVVDISRDIFRLESDIRKLTVRVDKRLITKNIQDSIAHFRKNFDLYFESFKTPSNIDAIITAGTNVGTYGESVGHILNRFSSLGFENRRLAQQVIQKSRSINNSLATKRDRFILGLKNYKESDLPKVEKATYVPEASETTTEDQSFSAYAKNVAKTRASAKTKQTKESFVEPVAERKPALPKSQISKAHENALNEQLEKSKRHMQYFVANAKKAEAAYKQRYQKIKQLHDEAVQEIDSSKLEIEKLKSNIANNSISKSFETAAEEERNNADFYRYATFGYMGVFFVLAGYLFIDVSSAGFDWVKTAMRSLLALTLMIPCSYVARESRNHRRQQHRYTQTALELKVLAPFKANLPESRLEPLKEEVIQNGLKSREVRGSYSDYYLMKNFDLLSELNRKLDLETQGADIKGSLKKAG